MNAAQAMYEKTSSARTVLVQTLTYARAATRGKVMSCRTIVVATTAASKLGGSACLPAGGDITGIAWPVMLKDMVSISILKQGKA